MKNVLILLWSFTFLNTLSAQEGKKNIGYKISGTVTGFTDSTLLYLSDLSDGSYKDIDSTFILNNTFKFSGPLIHQFMRVAIHTQGFKDRVSFWVDDSEVLIAAEKGKFKAASIKGSAVQDKSSALDSMISVSKNQKLDYIQFIKNNPTSILSAEVLSIYSSSWNKDTVSMLFKGLSKPMQRSIYGKNTGDFLSFNVSPQIGDRYVDFAQKNINGETISLSNFKGKIVLLEFWGSWCAPCREGHPALIKTYNEFKDKGFEILGIAAETDKKRFAEAVLQDGLPWQNLSDLKGDKNKVGLIYGISYYPANFLIDRNGIIIDKDLRGEKLSATLKELLQ